VTGEGLNHDKHHDRRFEKLGWTLDQVVSAPVIVVGHVEQIDGSAGGNRLYRVDVKESLKGNLKESTIYLVEPPAATGRLQPPSLFPAKYLLFLSPLKNEEAVQHLRQTVGANGQLPMYGVYANWMGAVSLDSRWREVTNYRIEADYGPGALKELAPAVRSVCEYMRATDEGKQKLAEQFRNRGGVYKQFIDGALGQQTPRDR
jgi:hypothetical protein